MRKQVAPTNSVWKVLPVFFISVLVLLLYAKAFSGKFLSFDDRSWIVENCAIRWLNFDTLFGVFNPDAHRFYQPVTYISWMLDYSMDGLNPIIFHAHNIILYILGSILVYFYLLKLAEFIPVFTGKQRSLFAFFATLLFVIHPAHVESVVWVTERKDLLALLYGMVFLNLSLLRINRVDKVFYRDPLWWGMFVSLVLAILSKGYVAVLAVVPLLTTFVVKRDKEEGLSSKDLPEHVPLILLMGFSIYFYSSVNAALNLIEQDFSNYSYLERFILWGNYLGKYLLALVYPANLTNVFVLTPDYFETGFLTVLGYAALVLTASGMVYLFLTKRTFWLVLFIIAVVYITPGTGILPLNWSARYLLFPVILPASVVAFVLVKYFPFKKTDILTKGTVVLLFVVLSFGLVLKSSERITIWLDDEHFYLDATEKSNNSDSMLLDSAIAFQKISPQSGWKFLSELENRDYVRQSERYQLTRIWYYKKMKPDEAYSIMLEALKELPDSIKILNLVAAFEAEQGKLEAARKHLRRIDLLEKENKKRYCRLWTDRVKEALSVNDIKRAAMFTGELESDDCKNEYKIFSLVLDALSTKDMSQIITNLEKLSFEGDNEILRLETLGLAYNALGKVQGAAYYNLLKKQTEEEQQYKACWGHIIN